ncbi:BQ5605_C006g04235 [Microbotryum silenes-dioicae]|uniref:BQ5605_C006g04235 protein n=1 Tax=Microbotryum silenes-dioicae TaxID=796604 RepID=A0A2X0M9D1_9BASI|nr:BQ5605_C006g04235 [Microbotryum silenes-dioicae]
MERQSTIQQGVLKKRGVHSGSCSSSIGKAEDWKAEAVRYRWGGSCEKLGTCQPIGGRKSSRKATDLGRRWQRYTAILVRQRQAVGTESCGRSWLGKLLRKCGLQTKARGRRAAHGLLQEGQACEHGRGRARLSPRRQTLAAKAEKTIDSIVRAQCEPK